MSVIALAGGFAGPQSQMGAQASLVGALFGVGAIVVLPLVYGIVGFWVGCSLDLFYNIVAGISGGIEFEAEQ